MSTQPADHSRGRISPKMIVAIVLGILALIFIFQNTGTGHVNVLFWDIKLPAWVWLLLIFLVGVAVGSMFPWFRKRRD